MSFVQNCLGMLPFSTWADDIELGVAFRYVALLFPLYLCPLELKRQLKQAPLE